MFMPMNAPSIIPRREWLTAVAVTLLLILLLAIPYALGYTFAAPGTFFTGLLMNPEDSQTYLAKMWQGYDGAWLYTIPFTSETHQPAFVGVFYVWLGQLARALGIRVTAIWHGSRIVAQFILSLTTFWFVAQFTHNKTWRWTAYLLALFGSGFGWLLFLLGQPYWLGAFPVDFKQPGAHLFFTLLTYPHIIIGTALMLFSVWGLAQLAQRPSWGLALALGLAHIALGIAYPFLIYVVALVAVLHYALLLRRQRRILWLTGGQYALAFLIPAPMYLYFAYTLRVNEVFHAWDVQAFTPAAPWPHYLVAFGPMLLPGALYAWRQPAERPPTAVLWLWVLAAALLLYAPLNPQRRFVQGVHAPLAILAAAAFTQVILPWLARSRPWQKLLTNPRYSTTGLSRLLIATFLLFMSLSNLYVLGSTSLSAVVQQPDPLFRPAAEQTAVTWMRQNVPATAVILCDYQSGNYIAGQGAARVVLGHWAETVDYEAKTAVVREFFQASTPDARRQSILRVYGVTHVWHGPREQALGSFDPATAPYLRPIYQQDGIVLYERVATGN